MINRKPTICDKLRIIKDLFFSKIDFIEELNHMGFCEYHIKVIRAKLKK